MIICPNCQAIRTRPVPVWPLHCRCGLVIHRDFTPLQGEPPPSVLKRGLAYLQAWWRWQSAGRPLRDEDEVTAIRTICRACEYYRRGKCSKCGCGVRGASWIGDKVAWATERCPIGKW